MGDIYVRDRGIPGDAWGSPVFAGHCKPHVNAKCGAGRAVDVASKQKKKWGCKVRLRQAPHEPLTLCCAHTPGALRGKAALRIKKNNKTLRVRSAAPAGVARTVDVVSARLLYMKKSFICKKCYFGGHFVFFDPMFLP